MNPDEARSEPSPRAKAYVRFVLRHGKLLWAIAALLAVIGTVRTAGLYARLKSDLEELLPRSAPSVVALSELRARVSGLQYLGVVVDVGSPSNLPAGERMLDDLAARIGQYPPDLVRAVRTGDAAERAFLERNAGLYLDLADLESIRARIVQRRDWEAARVEGTLDEEAAARSPAPALDFSDIQAKYESRTKGRGKTERGRFSSAELHTTLLLVEAGTFSTGTAKGRELLGRVKADLEALGGTDAYAKGMRVGYSGDVAISVEELTALVQDLSLSSVVVVVLVLASLVYTFRWWRSVVVILPPLFVATVLAFGIASFPPFRVTELNSNTAFLGSIVLGNGINVGIMLVARYLEERRRGVGVERALEVAVWAVRPGTMSSAIAASSSYASLALTDFRGFAQFGYIGGLGMVLAWASAFLLLPSLVRWVDRGERSAPRPVSTSGGIAGAVARLVRARPGVIVVVAALATVASTFAASRVGDATLERDVSRLRRRDTWTEGEGYWGRRMDAVLGSYLTPTAILTDDPEQAKRAAAALRRARDEGRLLDLVTSVRTIDDVLPTGQDAKLAVLEEIRDSLTPRIRDALSPERQDLVRRLVDEGATSRITLSDLPRTFTIGLREKDGLLDRVVLVYPRPSRALWEGRALSSFVGELRATVAPAALPGERAPRVAGSLALSADILDSIRRDGPRASAAAFLAVVVVVLLVFGRSLSTLRVIGTLLVGVLWLLGAMVALRVKINFANFIAFPITFGIGVEYAVNVTMRWRETRDTGEAVRATGGAVALCSATTIIGYSSLLMAENQALFLFGLLAVIGEVTCLVAAVVALPAAIEWFGRRRRGARAVPTVGQGHAPAE